MAHRAPIVDITLLASLVLVLCPLSLVAGALAGRPFLVRYGPVLVLVLVLCSTYYLACRERDLKLWEGRVSLLLVRLAGAIGVLAAFVSMAVMIWLGLRM